MEPWIGSVKAQTLAVVAPALGLRAGRLGSWGPCPGCSAETRGGEDRRLPIGAARDGKGWRCFACGVHGDPVDLISLVRTGRTTQQLGGAEWTELRSFCAQAGWCYDTGERASSVSIDRLLGHRQSIGTAPNGARQPRDGSGQVQDGTEAPGGTQGHEGAITGGPFAWRDGLAEDCAAALWSDPPSPGAEAVLAYLRQHRAFADETIREWRLGVMMVGTVPWLTIPLRDSHERTVNVRFRSIPPAKKAYRVCPGRPLPLYGVDRLGTDRRASVIVTEGELDVVALWQYGVRGNIVSGTAGAGTLKDEWLDVLEPYAGFTLCYDDDEAGNAGATAFAEKMGNDRCSRAVLPRKDAGDCLAAGLPADSVRRAIDGAAPMFGVELRSVETYRSELETLIANPQELVGRSTGSKRLDQCIGGVRPGVMVVTGDTGHGKAQPVDEPVLTPTGWRQIGELRVGDEVVAVDGTTTRVIGVYPQGVRPVCRVVFDDGAETRCDPSHLWEVTTDLRRSRGLPWQVVTTDAIAGSVRDTQRLRWRVPLVEPVQHPAARLPIDPYVLGVLLGDGALTQSGVSFTTADEEMVAAVAECLPHGLVVRTRQDHRSRAMCVRVCAERRGAGNPLADALVGLGLRGARSSDKFIPRIYRYAAVEQRVALLQGLMDTDGYVSAEGQVQFCTISPVLRDHVVELVRGLGGVAYVRTKHPRGGAVAYEMTVSLPNEMQRRAFRLQRKLDRVRVRRVAPARKVASVEPVEDAECVCIAVDHPRRLYVTRGHVVTHNTTWATWLCWEQARSGTPVMLTSFEQRPIGTVQKLLRMQMGGDFTARSPEERAQALADLGRLPLHVLHHYGALSAEKLMQSVRYGARRHGVKVVLVDHLGFLLEPGDDERQQIEAVVRALAITAYTVGVTIVLICHPRALSSDAQRPTLNDLKGASAIKQDASEVLVVVRDPPRPNAKPPRNWPASWIYVDKVRSEFGVADSKALLAFGPLSCVYADAWEQVPEGKTATTLAGP